jgi:hypothetical protein
MSGNEIEKLAILSSNDKKAREGPDFFTGSLIYRAVDPFDVK